MEGLLHISRTDAACHNTKSFPVLQELLVCFMQNLVLCRYRKLLRKQAVSLYDLLMIDPGKPGEDDKTVGILNKSLRLTDQIFLRVLYHQGSISVTDPCGRA